MVSEEDLVEEFELFGVDFSSSDSDSISKISELCASYRMDASSMVAQWVAFAHSTKSNIDPKYERLCVFEREKLAKKDTKLGKGGSKTSRGQGNTTISSLKNVGACVDVDDMCSAYSTPSPKVNPSKRQHTPDNAPIKKLTASDRSMTAPFSPSSFSPAVATPSKKYSARRNAGEVVLSYGSTDSISWKTKIGAVKPSIAVGAYDTEANLSRQYKYMFQKLTDRAHVLNDTIDELADCLQKHHSIDEWSHVALPIQEEIHIVGRVCCDSHGKLNPQSVLLQGSRTTSAGKCISVDLSQVKEFALFPGQVVAMDGVNITGQKFVAKKIYEGCAPPKIETRIKTENSTPLHVVIACGPFTTSDTLSYEPLADFVKYLQANRPHAVIMLGPFVDIKNSEIEKCLQTFDEHFEEQIEHIVQATQQMDCELILVPSYRDAHHDYVYPQPPYNINTNSPNVHCVSDPSLIHLDSTVIALTSTDVLFHLGAEESSVCTPGSSDRLTRLATHVIQQHSMYPLYPAAQDMNLDHDHWEQYANLPVTPDILVLPSDLRYFIKDISGCVCVNPGRLAKGQVGGTFTRLMISPHGSANGHRVDAQVLRI